MIYQVKTISAVCKFPSICTNVKKCFNHTRSGIINLYTYQFLRLSLTGHQRAKLHEASIQIAKQCSGINHVFSENIDETSRQELTQSMIVYEDFISSSEEQSIFDEVEPYMKRLRYEFDHWDDAIHGFRETERTNWNPENTLTLQRVKEIAFPLDSCLLNHVHVLDLAEDGHIKPHIDSARFCGNIIAGLCLLSDCVMRMVHETEKSKIIDVLLKRRSLYVMNLNMAPLLAMCMKEEQRVVIRFLWADGVPGAEIHRNLTSQFGDITLPCRSVHEKIEKWLDKLADSSHQWDVARYQYTHEVLGNTQSQFNGNIIKKSRRLSVICRNEPNPCDVK